MLNSVNFKVCLITYTTFIIFHILFKGKDCLWNITMLCYVMSQKTKFTYKLLTGNSCFLCTIYYRVHNFIYYE